MAADAGIVQRLSRAPLQTWLLAGACGWALLAWAGALAGMGGHVGDAAVVPGLPLPTPKPPVPDRIAPLSRYADAAARPLFTQDRRPRAFLATAPDTGEGEVVAQTLDFVLTGVLISPQVRLAIVQPTAGGDPQRVREGASPEGADGWRLVEVQPRRALFEGAGGQVSLDLRTFGAAGTPTPVPVQPGTGAASAAAVEAQPGPPPGSEAATTSPVDQSRIDEIRRRIEARRAQLRAGNQNSAAPGKPAPSSN